MFKPVHGIRGYLVSGISSFATAINLDDSSITLLKKVLGDSDYTYLLIRVDYNYEIVKTEGFVGNLLNVLRAQDGTTAQAFGVNSSVEFVLGVSALEDITDQQLLGDVELVGDGIITVTKTAPNHFTISAPPIIITSESDKILVGGDFPDFTLSMPVLNDCCD